MSRIGRQPVPIPGGVDVSQQSGEVKVKGPKGQLAQRLPQAIAIEIDGGEARLIRSDDKKTTRALHGLARALVNNMVTGVSAGFVKNLEIVGVGYRAEVKGGKLVLSVGYSHPVEMSVPKELKVSIDQNTRIRVEGIDKQQVGQFAADVRRIRPPEPYKGKGIRYADEHVRRKVGKAGVT
jgi:large subunit ribosomal protein L6